MKNKITTFLILTLTLGLAPLNFSQAITQNQIDAEVQIVCPDGSGNWSSGSGTIIDSKGIILTNRHVVQGKTEIAKACFIGFIESISKAPNFGTQADPNFAEVKYYTATDEMDAAILYLNNPTDKIYPYVNIWDSNSDNLKFGDKVEVVGFPSIGGSTITYTSGDFSGFGSSLDGTQNYIKTAAPVEHGNSGGAAYNSAGQFIGIPTMVVAGTLNSISYILSVNSIKSWLTGVLGDDYKQEVIEQKPVIEKSVVDIQDDTTPPDTTDVVIGFCEFRNGICYSLSYDWYKGSNASNPKFTWNGIYDENGIKGYNVYFGKNLNANPVLEGSFVLDNFFQPKIIETGNYYLIIQAIDNYNNISNKIIYKYLYDQNAVENYGIAFNIYSENRQKFFGTFNRNPYLQTSGNKLYIEWDDVDPNGYTISLRSNNRNEVVDQDVKDNNFILNIPSTGVTYSLYIKRTNFDKWFEFFEIVSFPPKTVNQFLYIRGEKEMLDNNTKNILTRELEYYLYKFSKEKYNHIISNSKEYNYYIDKYFDGYPIEDILIGIDDKRIFNGDWSFANSTNEFKKSYDYIKDKYLAKLLVPKLSETEINAIKSNIRPPLDLSLINRSRGLIYIQTERNGEAYYIYPENSSRYSLGRPKDAFEVMRKLGLGATHEFITGRTTYPENVLGKILLDVGDSGKAYYINPKDKKAYYLGRPADAFKVMRELGLGITNNDLNKIPEGNL